MAALAPGTPIRACMGWRGVAAIAGLALYHFLHEREEVTARMICQAAP